MRHHSNSPRENLDAMLECIIVQYANQLRAEYPSQKIRNAAVFASAIPVFARWGYIELVNAKTGIPKRIPEFLVDRIRRARRQPIWIPSANLPIEPFDIFDEMKPSMRGDAIVWQHIPSDCRRIGQLTDTDDCNQSRSA